MGNARVLVCGLLAVGIFATTSSAALAAQRFASPAGSGEACTFATPCDGRYAISGNTGSNPVADGDEVILLHGTYDFGNTSEVNISRSIDVHGEAGFPDPVLNGGSMNGLVRLSNETATLHDVDIEYGGTASSGAVGALIVTGGTAYRLIAHTSGNGNLACAVAGNTSTPDALIRDSICWGNGTGGVGVGLFCECSSFDASLRNVDAIGTTYGIGIESRLSPGGQNFTIDAKNVYADGGTADVFARASNSAGGTNDHAFVNLDYSAYDSYQSSQMGTNNTASVTTSGTLHNIFPSPAQTFVCPPGCGSPPDFHQLPTSPTIDAGTIDALTGSTDLDGNPRPQGAAMDIGAYEMPPVASPPGGGNPPGGKTPAKKRCKKKRKHRAVTAKKKCKKHRK
jgi:hypothetical protein